MDLRPAPMDSCFMDNTAKQIDTPPAIASADGFQKTGWQALLANSLTSADQLAAHLPVDREALERVIARYPMRINPYALAQIRRHGEPLRRQMVPCIKEISADDGQPDPLHEERQSPVNGIIHRYPDRVVFLVSNRCAVYCRFCMRKRQVGHAMPIGWEALQQGIDYIRATTGIRDVVLSGGDPLLRTDDAGGMAFGKTACHRPCGNHPDPQSGPFHPAPADHPRPGRNPAPLRPPLCQYAFQSCRRDYARKPKRLVVFWWTPASP